MHSTPLGDRIYAFHHGDFSGDVILTMPNIHIAPEYAPERGYIAFKIPFDAFETLVAEKVRAEMIERAEQATDQEILYGRK